MRTASGAFGSTTTELSFSLQHWCVWQSETAPSENAWPGGEVLCGGDADADVGFLPMMQRRRLSPLARAACAAAWHCRARTGDLPTVFFSNHGESRYYLEMLQGMASGDGVSPSRFSLCVHNAIAGLYSLQTGNVQPYLSLAGGTEGLFAAFIEAGGLLTELPRVMVVCYEQPLPPIYQAYVSVSENTWALAMALARPSEAGNRLILRRQATPGAPSASRRDGLVAAILGGRRSGCCRLERSTWYWCLDAG